MIWQVVFVFLRPVKRFLSLFLSEFECRSSQGTLELFQRKNCSENVQKSLLT